MGLIQKPPIGIQLNRSHTLANGLVGCWVMNEMTGSVVFDLSNNDSDGTNIGTAWVPDGLYFDGASRVSMPKIPIGNRAAFTISARFNGAAGGVIYGEGYSVNATTGPALFVGIDPNPPYSARYFVKESTAWKAITVGTTTVNDGWHTVNLVQKNVSSRTIYIDGDAEATNTDTVGDMSNIDKANIGVFEREAFGSYFVGDINNVYIHKREISDADIKLYNSEPYTIFEQETGLIYYYDVGWAGIINGISSANISKVNGISLTNISKVNGVASS